MTTTAPDSTFEVHGLAILDGARAILNTCRSGREMQDAVITAVRRNERWRGEQCINLLAPEAPTSPAVRGGRDRGLLLQGPGNRLIEASMGEGVRYEKIGSLNFCCQLT